MGYDLIKIPRSADGGLLPGVQDKTFDEMFKLFQPYTMTSIERMFALFNAVHYVVKNKIEGDFVECGVWKGGSAMMMAAVLHHLGDTRRKIYLYDTYEGMSTPSEKDKDYRGNDAKSLLEHSSKENQESVWCYSSMDEVKSNMGKTKFPIDKVILVKGKVEDTIPANLPEGGIALLRLDTDWYESTLHELNYLYPALVSKGVLIIDDYGHWQGSRKAVDEFFEREKNKVLLNRIDYTGRISVKP